MARQGIRDVRRSARPAGRAAAALTVVVGWLASSASAPAQGLLVGDDGRHLARPAGTPFFWLGDTAWELFHRLDLDEARRYLDDRASKDFTVVQAVVLAELGGLDVPNPNGDLPLEDRDPSRPVDAYFEHVDVIVRLANDRGLVVGMLPTWGKYWKLDLPDSIFTPENARSFGRFLGARYREADLVWILGGDNTIEGPEERAIVDAMAAGLAEGDGGAHLMTYHPRGPGRSSDLVHGADWLDFHMYQSSHASRELDNGLFAEHDRALEPARPTLDGEPRYEAIPVGFYFRNADPLDRFDAFDVRRAAYWSLLAGAAGHTYGNNNVWQMWVPGRDPVLHADIPWWEAIDHPGAFQMRLVRRLFESRPFEKLEPDPAMIVGGPTSGGAKVRAARARDGSFAFIYSPMGEPFAVDDTRLSGRRIKQIWYDPRYGVAHHFHTRPRPPPSRASRPPAPARGTTGS
ncbi:apiosidase-like domain-containing protein [Tautonia plasticadhaerens]|uniref:Endoglucanase n=1 Tax=Tautonia plasticadhaerens TaxID=2527974 RepID=A0A518HFG7_9BACT|nr:DUF4038 domain-containing protein [Tautonia plasticadhaerens]QDV39536.1 Putative endoglucanase [Tautonia plasticadhaerens]